MYTKLLVLALATANALANSESTVRHIDTIIAAKPVERSHPKYPRFAAQKRQEGWVKMSFVIDKQGNVIEPIIENSSGIKSFERAALNAAKKWKYSPATENGEAIEQCKTSVQFDFKLQGQTGVTRKFSSNYKKIAKAISEKNFSEAQALLSKLEDSKLWNFTENDWYWLADSEYARATGDKKRELASLIKTVNGGPKTLGKVNYLAMLQRKFFLELEFANYAYALKTIEKIQKSDASEEIKTQFSDYQRKLNAFINSDDYMARELIIGARGHTEHLLSRNRFQLSNIEGSLKEVEIRCENKRSRYTANDSSVWTIPKKWGKCNIYVKGEKNTKFNVVELANKV